MSGRKSARPALRSGRLPQRITKNYRVRIDWYDRGP